LRVGGLGYDQAHRRTTHGVWTHLALEHFNPAPFDAAHAEPDAEHTELEQFGAR
jgi:hypothetical protein